MWLNNSYSNTYSYFKCSASQYNLKLCTSCLTWRNLAAWTWMLFLDTPFAVQLCHMVCWSLLQYVGQVTSTLQSMCTHIVQTQCVHTHADHVHTFTITQWQFRVCFWAVGVSWNTQHSKVPQLGCKVIMFLLWGNSVIHVAPSSAFKRNDTSVILLNEVLTLG